jgi:pimeloyl-ACP methyl ester carboxylesterase
MEPAIRYATTSDGVSIAYAVSGQGRPYVAPMAIPFTHLQLEYAFPEMRAWIDRMSHQRLVVRYDGRGTDLSDRDVVDFSLDAQVRDLEAVADTLPQPAFDLWAAVHNGPVAIAYAAHHRSGWRTWCCGAPTPPIATTARRPRCRPRARSST